MYALFRGVPAGIVHLHWLSGLVGARGLPRSALRLFVLLWALRRLRRRGTAVVWTVHNLIPHESRHPRFDLLASALVARRCGALIVHGERAGAEVRHRLRLRRSSRLRVVPHGHYIRCYTNRVPPAEARRRLDLPPEELLLLCLGAIRPYKGIPLLIDAFTESGLESARLIIAGEPAHRGLHEVILRRIGDRKDIRYEPGFVPEDRLQLLFNAADAAVFAYRNALTSGAAVLAMSFGKPCIAPRLPGLRDVLDDRGAFFYHPGSKADLTEALRRAWRSRRHLQTMGRHNLWKASAWDWAEAAARTAGVYRLLQGARR